MQSFTNIDAQKLNQGMQLLQREFQSRGWSATTPFINSPHLFIDRGDGKTIHVFSSTPPTTSFAAAHLANNKFATHNVLKAAGIRQLATEMVGNNNHKPALELIKTVSKVVVKPVDGGHGKGITVDVSDEDGLLKAIANASEYWRSSKKVLVQEQYHHDTTYDLRLLCIDFKYVATIHRLPARVFGDGVSSVEHLIHIENSKTNRGEPYRAPLAQINMETAKTYLGEAIYQIPDKDKEVRVLGIANYGAGGETIDITDQIPKWMIAEAEQVSRIMSLPVCGVDYMVCAQPNTQSSEVELDAVVLEVNKCPSLSIHDKPTKGKSRAATAIYANYLSTL